MFNLFSSRSAGNGRQDLEAGRSQPPNPSPPREEDSTENLQYPPAAHRQCVPANTHMERSTSISNSAPLRTPTPTLAIATTSESTNQPQSSQTVPSPNSQALVRHSQQETLNTDPPPSPGTSRSALGKRRQDSNGDRVAYKSGVHIVPESQNDLVRQRNESLERENNDMKREIEELRQQLLYQNGQHRVDFTMHSQALLFDDPEMDEAARGTAYDSNHSMEDIRHPEVENGNEYINMNIDVPPHENDPPPSVPPLLPPGAHIPFIGTITPAPPGPSRRPEVPDDLNLELISRVGLEPEETWDNNIPETPFSNDHIQYYTWRRYKKDPRRPIPTINSLSEHCRVVALEFTSQLPDETPSVRTEGVPEEIPAELLEGVDGESRKILQLVDTLLDRRLRLAYGGRHLSSSRNGYRYTPYGMPTSTNKSTMIAARQRHRAIVNNNPGWESSEWNEKVRRVFYHFLRINNIKGVRTRASVPASVALSWESGHVSDASLSKMQFDWLKGRKSAWNTMMMRKILEFLRLEYDRLNTVWKLEWHSDEYISMKILSFFESLAREWKNGQRKPDEAEVECLRRLRIEREKSAKRTRQNVRRIYKYKTRDHITRCEVEMRQKALDLANSRRHEVVNIQSDNIRSLEEDLRIWTVARNIILRLGQAGMSSEESCVEDDKVVYRVKIVIWRRRMDDILRLIDRQRKVDPTIYTARGFKGVDRLRIPDGTPESDWEWKSRRIHSEGLPEVLYDPSWLQNVKGQMGFVSLDVSREEFEFFRVSSAS